MPDEPESHLTSLILVSLVCSMLFAVPPSVLSSAVQPDRSEPTNVEGAPADSSSPKNRSPGIPTSGFWNNTQSLGLLAGTAQVNKTAARGAQLLGVPTSFSWNSYFGGPSYMTPVRNQASCGSCWDFAAVGAMEAQYQISVSDPSTGIDLSEQNVLSCSGGSCSGWYIDWALEFLKSSGTPDEACNPYVAADRPCGSGRCADYLSRTYHLTSWSRISTDAANIKNYLYTHGPVVVAMPVFSDFPWYDRAFWQYYFYSHAPSGQYGGHAVIIVGWDDQGAGTADDYWIVRNSWGTTGGDVNSGYGGYFYITQDPTTGFFGIYNEAYVVSDVTPPTVTITLTESPTAYVSGTTTTTTTSYTSTLSVTSTVPTVTTVLLVPLTLTATIPSTEYVSSTVRTTVTSYTGTETSTSTVPTTVVLIPSTVGWTTQNIQYLTLVGTTTLTSYTDTSTVTSTVVIPTTVTVGPSTSTTTVQTTQVLTATGTTTVTAYTTTRPSGYTATTTSTSTTVVYTTVTNSGTGAGASSSIAYLGFITLLGVTAGHRVKASKAGRIPRAHNHEWEEGVKGVEGDQKSSFQRTFPPSVSLARHGAHPRCPCGTSRWRDSLFAHPSGRG